MEDRMFELSVGDRVSLGNILPRQGNFIGLMIAEDIRKDLQLSEAEMETFHFVIGPGKFIDAKGEESEVKEGLIKWDLTLEKKKKLILGPKAFALVFKTLDDMEKGSQLPVELISLYKMIVLPVKEAEELEKSKLKK